MMIDAPSYAASNCPASAIEGPQRAGMIEIHDYANRA